MEFKISQELLQAIANYLSSKPYNEVVWLLSKIQEEVNVQPKEEEKKKEDK